MDPRMKLLLSLAYIMLVFCALNPLGLVVCGIFTVLLFACARIPFRQAVRSIGPLSFTIVIAVLLNIFFTQGGASYVEWGFIRISEAGVYQAFFIGFRLFLLLLGMSLLTLTTTTIDITDAFEDLLSPLRRVGLPAHELAMMMGIALRFVPQFMTEVQRIYRAQLSRGAAFANSTWRHGIQLVGALIVPLFTSAFRHAETLSLAMDARCYHGSFGRTRLHPLQYSPLDGLALVAIGAMFACVIAANLLYPLLGF